MGNYLHSTTTSTNSESNKLFEPKFISEFIQFAHEYQEFMFCVKNKLAFDKKYVLNSNEQLLRYLTKHTANEVKGSFRNESCFGYYIEPIRDALLLSDQMYNSRMYPLFMSWYKIEETIF